MEIIKFVIENYRAIEKIEFKLGYSINPTIGINEAGKTTVLKAILAFDKLRDKYHEGTYLKYANNYLIKQKNCSISAFIQLEENEIKDLLKRINVNTISDDYKKLSSLKSNYLFFLERSLSEEKTSYKCLIEGVSKECIKKVTKYLVSKLPYILYFDDFADRVPDSIIFPNDYSTTGKIGRIKDRDWIDIIEEIFKRADTEGIEENEIALISYLKIEDEDKKSDILSDVESTLNKEIIEEWKRIKKSGKSFADDSNNLELVIVNRNNTFKFKVKDKSYNDKKRTFDISERSKGFQ